jgi:hypothetical protein
MSLMFRTVRRSETAPRQGLTIGVDGKLIESINIDQWRSASSSANNFNTKSMHEAMSS